MRLKFLDRGDEKKRIARALSQKEGTFCCLYGRRRCGKSRLLQETLPAQNAVYFVGDEREATLQRAALAMAVAEVIPGFDQVTYPDWSSLLDRWWRDAQPGSVLVLDEFPYLAKSSSELPSLLQKLIDQNRSKRVHLILSGSSQQMMQGLLLDASAPLYGRAVEIINVKPLGAAWIPKAFRTSKPSELLEIYSIWGGVPRYWELALDYPTIREAMEQLVLDPMGMLHAEPRRLLLDDLRETAQAASVLSLIGQGCNRISEIASRLGKPATSLTRPLSRLLELGLVRREQPFGVPHRNRKKTLYKIDDPFLAFWFRYVEPNRSRLEAGILKAVTRDIERHIQQYHGEVWEDLARRAVAHLKIDGIEWGPGHRWWGTGSDKKPMEIDVVSESVDGSVLFVGEAKLSLGRTALEGAQRGLKQKARNLPVTKGYKKVVEKIFVVDSQISRSRMLVLGKDVFRVLS
ncbi:MAG: ATP-binding protein [Candidatus Latescibacterota bacterium]